MNTKFNQKQIADYFRNNPLQTTYNYHKVNYDQNGLAFGRSSYIDKFSNFRARLFSFNTITKEYNSYFDHPNNCILLNLIEERQEKTN